MPKRKNTGLKEYWKGYRQARLAAYKYVCNNKPNLLAWALHEHGNSYHKGLSDAIDAMEEELELMEDREKRLER